jgi:hypothetical protein
MDIIGTGKAQARRIDRTEKIPLASASTPERVGCKRFSFALFMIRPALTRDKIGAQCYPLQRRRNLLSAPRPDRPAGLDTQTGSPLYFFIFILLRQAFR